MKFDNIGEFALLSEEQVFGSSKIDVIEKMGTKCAVTDFAILLGASFSDDNHVGYDSSLKGRTGSWVLLSSGCYDQVEYVEEDGDVNSSSLSCTWYNVRPVLSFSNISDISSKLVMQRGGFLGIKYGEYPQYVVDARLGNVLDRNFLAGRLKKTGKTYTIGLRGLRVLKKIIDDFYADPEKFEYEEFEYNGKRYLRVESNNTNENFKLTNGDIAHPGEYYWVEVSPIIWLVDEKSKMLVSKTSLFSGMPFCYNEKYKGNFKKTDMYTFLNKYFAKDIIPLNDFKKTETNLEDDMISKEEELYYEILNLCNSYNDKKISDRLANIVKEYQDVSMNIIEDDIEEKNKHGIFSGYTEYKSKDLYDDYIKKLSNFLDVLKHYSIIINVINDCREDNSNSNNELVKDIQEFKNNICKSFEEDFCSKYINILNSKLDCVKEEIVNDILNKIDKNKNPSEDKKFRYENYDDFELSFRGILHKLLFQFNEESRLELINEDIELGKNVLATNVNSKYDALRFDLMNIQEIVEYIESITKDKKILNKLEKFKNIKLDLDKNIDENIEYVYGLLKEIIKIKLEVEYIYTPMKYKSRL